MMDASTGKGDEMRRDEALGRRCRECQRRRGHSRDVFGLGS